MSVLQASELPHYLQWWRSLTEWIDGVGIIGLLPSILRPRALELYYSESRDQKLLPSTRSTACDCHRRLFDHRSIAWSTRRRRPISAVLGMPYGHLMCHRAKLHVAMTAGQ